MASYLAPAVIYNAIADLKGSNCGAILNSTNITGQPKSCTTGGGGFVQLSTPRKRKHISGLSGGYPASSGLERELATNDDVVSIPVQISALKALEALLTVVCFSALKSLIDLLGICIMLLICIQFYI
jgi:hypothetical protein